MVAEKNSLVMRLVEMALTDLTDKEVNQWRQDTRQRANKKYLNINNLSYVYTLFATIFECIFRTN